MELRKGEGTEQHRCFCIMSGTWTHVKVFPCAAPLKSATTFGYLLKGWWIVLLPTSPFAHLVFFFIKTKQNNTFSCPPSGKGTRKTELPTQSCAASQQERASDRKPCFQVLTRTQTLFGK